MKPIILFSLFCLCTFSAFSQNSYTIGGSVTDTVEKIKLSGATVSVLDARDSIMQAFVWTGADGKFAINKLPTGKFILLVTYPGYADYIDLFTLDAANNTHDFGDINLILKSRLLADVLIKGKLDAIKIKGDTTEFNAKAFVIQPNDKVENLLRQLPGIQIDQDGKITAQGQTVSKVLLDGEEFFGDDPKLVTRNIRADMVDKVQLYDKKSDQAAFTGVDDGKRTKTINIKLRTDKNNGEFGSLEGNIATAGYYGYQIQFNKFKPTEKFAVYGTAANDGDTGVNYQDNNSIGSGNDNIQFVDGGIVITGGGSALDTYSGNYDRKGIPVVKAAGAHYDGKWNDDKESINANYKIGAIDVTGNTNTTIQQILPTGIINTSSNQTFHNYAFHQKLDATYQVKLDTTSTLKITADGTDQNFHVDNNYITSTDTNKTLLNRAIRSVINQGTQQILNAGAFYTKKFKKPGRTLSWSLSENYNHSNTDGYLNSTINYYDKLGAVDSSVIINQHKTTDILSTILNSNITYSGPITQKIALLVNYGFAVNNSTSNNKSFDASTPGVYNILDPVYSNDYKFNQVTNQMGAILTYKYKKTLINFGTKLSDVAFSQTDEFTGITLKRDFLNWLPQAMFQYRFSQQQVFTVNYYGNTTQPTIGQIQPVLVNTDPLNITIGNPDLKPSFTNRFLMSYYSSQTVSGQSMSITEL
jgi:Outer membrane protein beta-barrel family/Carboxypeptidase regulatory-like domain